MQVLHRLGPSDFFGFWFTELKKNGELSQLQLELSIQAVLELPSFTTGVFCQSGVAHSCRRGWRFVRPRLWVEHHPHGTSISGVPNRWELTVWNGEDPTSSAYMEWYSAYCATDWGLSEPMNHMDRVALYFLKTRWLIGCHWTWLMCLLLVRSLLEDDIRFRFKNQPLVIQGFLRSFQHVFGSGVRRALDELHEFRPKLYIHDWPAHSSS